MGFFNKLSGKSDEELLKEKVRRETDKRAKKSLQIADYFAALGECRRKFEDTIAIERLNALERREKRIGDAPQKQRIYDAVIGLLAIEELELDLQSAASEEDLESAKKKLGFVIKQTGRLDPNTSITKKNLKDNMGFAFDNTTETETFVERADLVDEQFVENLIQGCTLDQCLQKSIPNAGSAGSAGGQYDFTGENQDADADYINNILRKNADKH